MKKLFVLPFLIVIFSSFVSAGVEPIPAVTSDFDGEGRADLAVFRPSTGIWYLQRSVLGFQAIPFGISSDKPVSADYNGDAAMDIAVYRNGVWYILRSNLGFAFFEFGNATDLPIANSFIP